MLKINCEKCGAINEEDSKFCEKCGKSLKSENLTKSGSDLINKIDCPFCGQKIPMNAVKCGYCGEWVDSSKKESHIALLILGYVFTLLFPIIGLIIAIYLLTRDSSRDKTHGAIQLVIAILNIIVGVFLL